MQETDSSSDASSHQEMEVSDRFSAQQPTERLCQIHLFETLKAGCCSFPALVLRADEGNMQVKQSQLSQ